MRVYISVDIEGISTIVNSTSTGPQGRDYQRACKQMTAEANAAVMGALAAGATAVVVNDSHGSMTNLIPAELHPAAELIQGSPKPLSMMEGIEAGFDAAMFVGYHSRMGQPGILSHTISSATVSNILLNGQLVGETALNACIAGYYGIPVVMVAGDAEVAKEAQATLGQVETAIVKTPITRFSARSLHPERACEVIKAAAEQALSDLSRYQPLLPAGPYTFTLEFINAGMADAASVMPGAVRENGNTVSFTHDDYIVAFRGLRTMISLARP
ncbi:MAG: M55 family metallopeptidase [Bacillota bacterium]|jgi:D-amino peptidase